MSARRPLIPADRLPFDWDAPLCHPNRDQWGEPLRITRRKDYGGGFTMLVTVDWGNHTSLTTRPLAWFRRSDRSHPPEDTSPP